MSTEPIDMSGTVCHFCGKENPVALKAGDAHAQIWFCEACNSLWGHVNSRQKAEAMLAGTTKPASLLNSLIERLRPRATREIR